MIYVRIYGLFEDVEVCPLLT